MAAVELPETGTAVEASCHGCTCYSNTCLQSAQCLPGNFILNGLPPAPGAPFAAPEVDDDGNSTFNKRRYKAAVIQPMWCSINKVGTIRSSVLLPCWMMSKTPSMVSAHRNLLLPCRTSETVEFWHTNLVPNYYELDDFQVRTPTDILRSAHPFGEIRCDLNPMVPATGSTMKDGTFSPAEVQQRIAASSSRAVCMCLIRNHNSNRYSKKAQAIQLPRGLR